MITRPPVVVILGHVDSGKTSILDYIRKTHVAEKESGGITQRVGAYQIEKNGRKITFIDTPGHEAFSAMRSRGASAADVAVLIVDACKGVEPQTKEAIGHIKKANIPFIVALNKIDRAEANPEKVKRELVKEDILVESMAGKVPSIEVSAISGKGMDELADMIFLVAEMESLKADLTAPVKGWVLESYLDSQKGIIAALIAETGTLNIGDIIGTPSVFGKIKNIQDFQGKPVEKALPSDPILVFGFEGLPKVGEKFKSFPDLESAKQSVGVEARFPRKETEFPKTNPEQTSLSIILKADFLGSLEAISEVLKIIPQDKVVLQILKAEAGDVDESDIKLAKSSKAKILAFRVKTNPIARAVAQRDKIKVVRFEVIYDLVESVRNLMEAMVSPESQKVELGRVKILGIFLTEKSRQVIGGRVFEGEIKKTNLQIEVLRGEEFIGKGRLINLQKNKKDAERCVKGEECGMLFEGDAKVEAGDILVFYTEERTKGEL